MTFLSKRRPAFGVTFIVILVFLLVIQTHRNPGYSLPIPYLKTSLNRGTTSSVQSWLGAERRHPIDELVKQAAIEQELLEEKEVKNLTAAAAAYRQRRGRHPPPHFEKWVYFAGRKNALLIEELFDGLYDDLDPLWGVEPAKLRKFPKTWPYTISIRNGSPRKWNDQPRQAVIDFMSLWLDGIAEIPYDGLPDVDLAFNSEDESHMFVPFEKMQKYRADGNARKSISTTNVTSRFKKYRALPLSRPTGEERYQHTMYPGNVSLWDIAKESCPTSFGVSNIPAETDYTTPIQWPSPESMGHMYSGFVANFSSAKSACANPYIRNIHGSFIGMQTYSINAEHTNIDYKGSERAIMRDLVPILSGSRIHDMNQEILIPAGVHWQSTNPTVNVQDKARIPWEEKKSKVLWRGVASGGINTAENWTRFQRHRFMAMLNGTLVAAHKMYAEVMHIGMPKHVPSINPPLIHNFPLPNAKNYPDLAVLRATPADLGAWVSSVTDAGFTSLRCWPGFGPDDICSYSGQFHKTVPLIPGNDLWKYKVLPDLDGASYSGRFRAFVQSESLPIKATIYDEWSDSRLIPWKHFVPMDNTYMDWWGIMEYFLGYKNKVAARDEVGKQIAEAGAEWAGKVMRRDDMVLYMYRLILELARVQDDDRDRMGYIEDLL